MKRFGLTMAWLIGAVTIAVASLVDPGGDLNGPRVAVYLVAQTHYALSLAAAFMAFATFYFLLALRPVILARRVLALGHLGLMGLGAIFILSPRAVIGLIGLGWTPSNSVAAFTMFNHVSLLGYLLTVAGLAIFVALLALGVTSRLGRQWKAAT